MTNYAYVTNGRVAEVITPILDDDGIEIPIESRFTADFAAQLAPCDASVLPGMLYDGKAFASGEPSAAEELAAAQTAKIAELYANYQVAAQLSVSYKTVAGVPQTFQADSASQNTLLIAATGYGFAGATPAGFYWVALDNTQVPFTLDDLKGLYGVMLAQGNVAFNKLQTLKASVRSASTSADVQAVAWT
jgi:hypothetical protein